MPDSLLTSEGSPLLAVSEPRNQYLLRLRIAFPRFLQGVFPFRGRGIFERGPLDDSLAYTVPAGKTAQVLYFRAGNPSDDLLYLTLSADGNPIRYFPVGSKSDVHVPLAIVESYAAGTRLQIELAAPRGLDGTVIVNVGILEFEPEG